MKNIKKIITTGLVVLAPTMNAWAEPETTSINTLRDAVNYSVLNNPKVHASWYDFRADREEKRVAQGNYLPSVDLIAEAGSVKTDVPNTPSNRYGEDSARLTLTQMLFDGFSTHYDVKRLDLESLASYYQLRQVSEETAKEAADAYIDVLRYQKLVELAKENYKQHRLLFNDIEERTGAGISRGADSDQARGRLSLSETNLLTEVNNLHDVMVRFQRIVGVAPTLEMADATISSELIPDTKTKAISLAYTNNPTINAAIETLRAAKAELKQKNAPMMPRFDLRLRQELEHEQNGIEGRFEEQAIEVVMTYNLFNGGSDSAQKRQYYERLNAAKERRIQACQEVRQETAISYNSITSLEEQVGYLRVNQDATSRARDAYRDQFDLGQRTLLDLLDEENEYFEISRTLVNAEFSLIAAKVATLESTGDLLNTLNVVGLSENAAQDLKLERDGDYAGAGRCPLEAPSQLVVDKDALMAQIMGEPTGEVVELSILNVNFDFASSIVKPQYESNIETAAGYLKDNPDTNLGLDGYTDEVGSVEYNQILSKKRADAVKSKMVEEHDISADRLRTDGHGKSYPIEGTDEENRRVVFTLDE